MPLGNFLQQQKELLLRVQKGVNSRQDSGQVHIRRFEFHSEMLDQVVNNRTSWLRQDSKIGENLHFTYDVFVPAIRKDHRSAILLLHGLNERSWDKYLQWADYLAVNTGKPVILFPIAFHMNRSPSSWANPRIMKRWVEKRVHNLGLTKALSFANVALSNRLSDEPSRFYYAGRQTMNDLVSLAEQIGHGRHPLFEEGAVLDILGYSIGSFLAEILLMANFHDLFSSSRLFVFCGGSIFRQMHGTSRYIMDEEAYERLLNYYCHEWFNPAGSVPVNKRMDDDEIRHVFDSMISPEIFRDERESFFKSGRNRIAGISLRKDTVMPYSGVEACMGTQTAGDCFELIDFPFDYSHETPFPMNKKIDPNVLENSFHRVFRKCAAFLA